MNEMTFALIEQLREKARANEFVDVQWYMKKSALLLIASIGYGMDLNNRKDISMEQILEYMDDMMEGFFAEAFNPLFIHNPMNHHLIRRTKEAGSLLRKFGHDAIKQRRSEIAQNIKTPNDLLVTP